MTNVVMPIANPNKILFAGDWHGSFDAANAALQAAAAKDADLIIQVGDFGFWAGEDGKQYLDDMSLRSIQLGVPVLWIDGNHENFDDLLAIPVDPTTGLRPIRENVWHIPRNSRWEWNGLRFAALGGATSLDRPQRTPGRSWWPEEAITLRQAYEAIDDGECDVFISHDCPEGVPIPGIDLTESLKHWPREELATAWAHREQLKGITKELKPAVLVHGHYHIRHYITVSEFHTNTTVVGLSEDGTGEGNRWAISLSDLSELVAKRRNSPFPPAEIEITKPGDI